MINVIRCSSLARAMRCKGSLFFKDLPKQETNAAAEEGTACGELLERILLNKTTGTHAENGVMFDNDMKFYTHDLNKEIKSRAQSEILCETRIDWQTRSGIWIRGQYDVSYIKDGKLCVDDLKYGWGIVEVKDNWQLLGYGIGEVIRRGQAFDSIVFRILQPRPHHEDGPIREWEISYTELLEYKEQIEQQMEKIAQQQNEVETGKHCRYCPAAASACPALNKSFYRGIEVAHEFVQDDLDNTELSHQMDLIDRVSEMIKIKKQSIEQLAVHRIKAGQVVPNYMTADRKGDRKWKSHVSPDLIKMLTGKDITEKIMLSPAKAEKIGVPKEMVKSMVDRPFLGQKLKRCDHAAEGDKIFGDPNAKQ